jgi:hypothetical protein
MSGEAPAWAELLQLDADEVLRVGTITAQWANALARLADRQDEGEIRVRERQAREAASLYVLAGSYQLLVGHDSARNTCAQAASRLSAVGSSFAQPLAVCGNDEGVLRRSLSTSATDDVSPTTRAHLMLGLAWLSVSEYGGDVGGVARSMLSAHHDQAAMALPIPVGRLDVPLEVTASLLTAAVGVGIEGRSEPDRLSAAARSLLLRTNEVVATAMTDHYHWHLMMSYVMPVEPEVVAPLAVAVVAADRARATDETIAPLGDLIGGLPPPARVALGVAEWIARAT